METEENTRRFHKQIDWIVNLVEKSKLPDEQKQKILEQVHKIKELYSSFHLSNHKNSN